MHNLGHYSETCGYLDDFVSQLPTAQVILHYTVPHSVSIHIRIIVNCMTLEFCSFYVKNIFVSNTMFYTLLEAASNMLYRINPNFKDYIANS